MPRIYRAILACVLLNLSAVAWSHEKPGAMDTGSSGSGSNKGGGGGGGNGAGPLTIALKIPNETVPAGGVAQMKFLLTEPTPISSGRPHSYFDSSMFDDVWGIQLFNSAGDVNGVAIVSSPDIWISFESTGSVQGTDYPVMTMSLHARDNAAENHQSQFGIDPLSSWTIGGLPATFKPVAPATVTIGGDISIINVVPGGGLVPAGGTVKIFGLGFADHTQVQISGLQPMSITVVNPNEIDIVVPQATDMTGKAIHVVNSNSSQDTYYSYMRGIDLGSSNRSILSSAIPIFSQAKHSQATFAPIAAALQSQFTGLAMQNPNLSDVHVTVTYTLGLSTLTNAITIPSGCRFMREIQDLVGTPAAANSSISVSADQPIQVFGFLVDTAAQTVTPFPATTSQP